MKEPADRIRVVASGLPMVCLSIAATGESAGPQGASNGFSLEEAIVDVREIIAAGPGRDSIPALVHPRALSVADSPWPGDVWVIGVDVGGEARAYPLAVLNGYEFVNDTLGGCRSWSAIARDAPQEWFSIESSTGERGSSEFQV